MFNLFVKEESAANIRTSYASMNRCGKTNAKKGLIRTIIHIKNLLIEKLRHMLLQSGWALLGWTILKVNVLSLDIINSYSKPKFTN